MSPALTGTAPVVAELGEGARGMSPAAAGGCDGECGSRAPVASSLAAAVAQWHLEIDLPLKPSGHAPDGAAGLHWHPTGHGYDSVSAPILGRRPAGSRAQTQRTQFALLVRKLTPVRVRKRSRADASCWLRDCDPAGRAGGARAVGSSPPVLPLRRQSQVLCQTTTRDGEVRDRLDGSSRRARERPALRLATVGGAQR